jgi:DNA-binding NtrC family response regulator
LAATHRDLERDVREGRFREDLFYRLHVLRLQLPPLRERVADIAPLSRFLLARICVRLGVRSLSIADEALRVLEQHAWPGNVRELNNVLERAAVLRVASPLPISADELRAALGVITAAPRGGMIEKVAAVERASIIAALDESGGKKSHAAQLLGISRPTLDKKIAELGIVVPK